MYIVAFSQLTLEDINSVCLSVCVYVYAVAFSQLTLEDVDSVCLSVCMCNVLL